MIRGGRLLRVRRVGGWLVFQAKRAHGSRGLSRDPSRPPPRCQCYDMCTAPLFSLTTTVLHLPGWAEAHKNALIYMLGIRPSTFSSSCCTYASLPVGQARPSRVINNRRIEWGKVQFPLQYKAKREECLFFSFFSSLFFSFACSAP